MPEKIVSLKDRTIKKQIENLIQKESVIKNILDEIERGETNTTKIAIPVYSGKLKDTAFEVQLSFVLDETAFIDEGVKRSLLEIIMEKHEAGEKVTRENLKFVAEENNINLDKKLEKLLKDGDVMEVEGRIYPVD